MTYYISSFKHLLLTPEELEEIKAFNGNNDTLLWTCDIRTRPIVDSNYEIVALIISTALTVLR